MEEILNLEAEECNQLEKSAVAIMKIRSNNLTRVLLYFTSFVIHVRGFSSPKRIAVNTQKCTPPPPPLRLLSVGVFACILIEDRCLIEARCLFEIGIYTRKYGIHVHVHMC